MPLKVKILLFLIFSFGTIYSQTRIDSLINLSANENDEYIKADLFLQISNEIENADTIKCFEYINKGIIIAKKIKNNDLLAQLFYTKAHTYDGVGEYLRAVDIYKICIKYAKKSNNILLLTKSHINIGVTQYYYGLQNEALSNYQKSLKYSLQLNDSNYIAKNYNNIALIYKSKGNYVDAIVNFHKSLKINTHKGNKKNVANTYINIGSIYWEQEDYKEAKKCYAESAKIYLETNDKKGLADSYINLGLIYKAEKDTITALKYHKKAVLICEQSNNKFGLATAYLNIAVIYDGKNDLINAEKYYRKSLKIAQELSYKKVILSDILNLSMIYAIQKKHKKAEEFAKQALAIAKETKDTKSIYNAYKTLAINYSHEGKFNLAYDNIRIFTELKDSLYNLEKNKQLNEIRTKYETEKKEIKISLLKKKNTIQTLKLEREKQIIRTSVVIIFLTILSLIIFFVLYIQKRKSYIALVKHNIQLTKIDIEKEKTHKISKSIKKDKIKQLTSDNLKYSKSLLTYEQKEELHKNIVILMDEEKCFLNPNLTIDEFAKNINTNRGYISQIVNEFFNTNFNNFINEYRVKEARKLLINQEFDNYSLEGIASLAGFNTRATFNNAFKKFTGVTPSFFKNNSRKGD